MHVFILHLSAVIVGCKKAFYSMLGQHSFRNIRKSQFWKNIRNIFRAGFFAFRAWVWKVPSKNIRKFCFGKIYEIFSGNFFFPFWGDGIGELVLESAPGSSYTYYFRMEYMQWKKNLMRKTWRYSQRF